jgi:hypothetical protein
MDNFFNYVTKQVKPEEVDLWFKSNNIIPEKLELFSDFAKSLNELIVETYLGESDSPNETKVTMSEEDKINHFIWCWNKVVGNFQKENIIFSRKGEHFDYFISFFQEIFYKQENKKVRDSVSGFFDELFDIKKPFTKSDLDMINSLYKGLDKNMNK